MPTGEVQFSSSSVNRPNSWNNTQKAGLSESLTPSIKISHPSMTTSEKSLTPLNPVGRAASQPVLSRQVTRSTAKMAEAEAKTALTNFVTGTDRSSHFEARVNTLADPPPSVHTYMVRIQQIQALWNKEREYETCSGVLSVLNSTDTMTVMLAKSFNDALQH